jgi:TolB-like protein
LQVGVPVRAKPPEPKQGSWLAPLGAGIVALVFFGANRPASVASNAPRPTAVPLSVVAPSFANLSDDPVQDYLADAPTDQLTTGIARLGDTFVIARNMGLPLLESPMNAPTRAIPQGRSARDVTLPVP